MMQEEATNERKKVVPTHLTIRIDPDLRTRLNNYRKSLGPIAPTERRVVELALRKLFNEIPDLEAFIAYVTSNTNEAA